MHSQKLSHKVQIDRPATAVDAVGQRLPGWEPVCSPVWAAIRPVGTNERLAAAQIQSEQTHVVTVRYSPTIAALQGECRIVFGTRTFGLVGYPRNIDEANRWLLLDCTEGQYHGR